MKIYLINLDRHPERLAHMRKQLNGVPFERISAVDGSKDPTTTKGLSRFELACLESHKLAWRQFLNCPEGCACFLEDDLHIWPGLAGLTGSDSWIPTGAHSVKLDTYLTREGAARYLDLTASASLPADYALFPNHPRRLGLRIYQLCLAIAIQDHLLDPNQGGHAFTTTMAPTDGSATLRRSSTLEKLAREGVRLAGQAAGLIERSYQKVFLRVETTTVDAG
jgi:GR25 family glycosyltransferase involved in LPS biosynthesis